MRVRRAAEGAESTRGYRRSSYIYIFQFFGKEAKSTSECAATELFLTRVTRGEQHSGRACDRTARTLLPGLLPGGVSGFCFGEVLQVC